MEEEKKLAVSDDASCIRYAIRQLSRNFCFLSILCRSSSPSQVPVDVRDALLNSQIRKERKISTKKWQTSELRIFYQPSISEPLYFFFFLLSSLLPPRVRGQCHLFTERRDIARVNCIYFVPPGSLSSFVTFLSLSRLTFYFHLTRHVLSSPLWYTFYIHRYYYKRRIFFSTFISSDVFFLLSPIKQKNICTWET